MDELSHANRLFAQNKLGDARQIVQQVLQDSPDNADALNLYASIIAMQGNVAQAIGIFKSLTIASPDNAQIRFNLGRCYQLSRDFVSARRSFEAAVQIDPDNLPAWSMLSRGYQANDELAACIGAASNVLRLAPDTLEGRRLRLEAYITQSTAFLKKKEYDKSASLLEKALQDYPDDPRLYSRLGDVRREQDRNAEAAENFLKAAGMRTDPAIDQMSAAIAYMRDGSLDEAFSLLSLCRKNAPENQRVLSAYGPLLWELGKDDEYHALFDYQRKITSVDIAGPPSGYGSMGVFNAALNEELRKHPTLSGDRITKSTTGGLQTGNVFANPPSAIAALMDIVNAQVGEFLANARGTDATRQDEALPAWNLVGWGVILKSQGFQSPHNHPSAMVSGVYYTQVPDEVSESGSFPGCIEFGPPNESYRMSREPERHRFLAQEGRMYLFPSHFWHRTIPFESNSERICIAFDANPVPPQRMAGDGG